MINKPSTEDFLIRLLAIVKTVQVSEPRPHLTYLRSPLRLKCIPHFAGGVKVPISVEETVSPCPIHELLTNDLTT